MNNEKIITGSWLPVFPGFYGTVLEWLIDNAYDNDHEYIRESDRPEELKEAMLDHYYESKAYYTSVEPMQDSISRQCVKLIEAELKKLGVVESITFQKLVSPKYYNFSNDSINVEVVFSAANLQAIRHYVSEHFAQWREYLKSTYTSCDGFISHHDNNPGAEEWFVDNALNDRHNAGAVLEFICQQEDINTDFLFNFCDSVEGIDCSVLEKECLEQGWYVPDTLWNRLKAYLSDRMPRFKVVHGWGVNQYVINTKKQTYIFVMTKAEPNNINFIVKRYCKYLVFGRLRNEKKNNS